MCATSLTRTLIYLVCITLSASSSEEPPAQTRAGFAEDSSKNVTYNVNYDLLLRVDPDQAVTNFADFYFMASIQRAPGRIGFGGNGVFIAASWVLSCTAIIDKLTKSSFKAKQLVVIHNSTNPFNFGKIYNVKKLVKYNAELYLLKLTGETHSQARLVFSMLPFDPCDELTLLRWDKFSENLLKSENVALTDPPTCTAGAKNFCIEKIPLYMPLDTCAVLINLDKEIVGLVTKPSDNIAVTEQVVSMAAHYKAIFAAYKNN